MLVPAGVGAAVCPCSSAREIMCVKGLQRPRHIPPYDRTLTVIHIAVEGTRNPYFPPKQLRGARASVNGDCIVRAYCLGQACALFASAVPSFPPLRCPCRTLIPNAASQSFLPPLYVYADTPPISVSGLRSINKSLQRGPSTTEDRPK